MTQPTLNADLSTMSYDEFQNFMRGLASLYSDVSSEKNFMALHRDLRTIAKKVEMLPLDLRRLFGAYEIANNQVVLAIFHLQLAFPDDDNLPAHIDKIEVSFAEDTPHLRCPVRVRELLTQPEYVKKADQAYPRMMEELIREKFHALRNRKVQPREVKPTVM